MEKRREAIRRGKPTNALDAKIEHLKHEPEVDTKYKPIRYTDLISKGATLNSGKDVLDRDMIYYDPVKQGNARSLISIFVRSLVPGSLGIGFLISEPLINIVLYYAFLVIGFAWTISTQYVLTRQNTKTIYYSTRKNKLTLLREMKAYIQKRLSEIQSLKNETKENHTVAMAEYEEAYKRLAEIQASESQ
jgi:hypothetical protein